jgi:tetratricopeptide (TPR) repeat protein
MKRLIFIFSCLLSAMAAHAQNAGMQSPAYQECTALATSNPEKALAKADVWLKIDAGIAAQHCRAMALFGLRRFSEAGDALAAVRESIAPESITLRSYVARQAAQAYLNASSADKALMVLSAQINEISNVRSDNVTAAKQTSNLLLDRARLNITYGKLDEATKDLDHAVSLTPINEEVLIERAGVFEKLGDIPLARNDLDTVLTINANNNVAKNARKRLNGKSSQATEPEAPAANATATAPTANEAPATAAFTPTPPAAPQPQTVDTAVVPVTSNAVQMPAAPAAASTPTSLPFVEPAAVPSHTGKAAPHKPQAKKATPVAAAPVAAPAATTAPALPLPSAAPALPVPVAKPAP